MGRTIQDHPGIGAATVSALKFLDSFAEKLQWVANALIVAGALSLLWLASDRAAPFVVTGIHQSTGEPGAWITITADVKRDLSRKCEATFSRYIYDVNQTRYDIGTSIASAEMIERMDRLNPDRLAVSLELPRDIAVGPADLVTTIEYRCNKVHRLWPIVVTTHLPFTVSR